MTPFERVVSDLTDGCGCACHTGVGYRSTCEHCTPDSLDAAWAEAEAALPEGWHICEIMRHCHVGDEEPGAWMAEAHDQNRWESEIGEGPTSAAAVRALTAKLRERG